ncbi:MAG TPA: thiosulfate oxidation carrier protein SoxY [Methylomirabilota bacterium]
MTEPEAKPLRRPDEAAIVLARVFAGQNLGDGAEALRAQIAHIVEEDTPATLDVEVNWDVLLRTRGARLYVIADENRVPLLAQIDLRPDVVSRQISLNVRLDASTHLRIVLAFDDGTLLQTVRWVWVLPRDPDVPGPDRRPR